MSPLSFLESFGPRRCRQVTAAFAAALVLASSPAKDAPQPNSREMLAAETLAQALSGEIALQRRLMPQAWKSFMKAAETSRDARFAERAWETALAAKSPENAALSLDLWKRLAPKDSRTGALIAAEGLISDNAGTRAESEARLKKALTESDNPAELLSKVVQLTVTSTKKHTLYESLSRLAAPYAKGSAATHLILAQAAESAGLRDKAMQHALNAMKTAPDDSRVLMAGIDYLFRADAPAATRQLRSFLKKHPNVMPARLALAKSLIRTGSAEDLRRELAEINRLGGTNPQTVYAAGTVAEEAGLFEDAEKAYKKYLVLIRREEDGRFIPDAAYARLGMVKLSRGDKTHALEWFGKVEKGDTYLPAKMKEAELLADLGQTDAACEVIKNIRTDAKQKAKLMLVAVDLYLQAGNRDAAYQTSREALTASPNDPQTIYKAAQLSETTSRYNEAEALLAHYIEIRPNDANGYNALGYMWLENDRHMDKAGKYIERAMELSQGKDGFITDSMGWLRFKEGKPLEAESYLRDAFKLQPDIDIALHLAEVLITNDKMKEARGILELVLKNSPDNITAQRLMRQIDRGPTDKANAP